MKTYKVTLMSDQFEILFEFEIKANDLQDALRKLTTTDLSYHLWLNDPVQQISVNLVAE